MTMETENPIVNNQLVSWSPSTYSEMSTDGDASITQSGLVGEKSVNADAEKQDALEPKAKKRRKQSKPLKCQSLINSVDLPGEDMNIRKADEPEFHHSPEPEFLTSMNEEKAEDLSSEKGNSDESKVNPENMSQKNILMQMNEMLYGNLLRASSGSQPTCQKSQSSLNLLTDMMSPDSNDETSRAVVTKNAFPTFYPQMPPLLPLTPGDLAGELSKLTSVFSQMAELPTQLMQTNLSSNRSFITSNGVRVFNPEAYCELCEKEFCNKYFLKTHKANKHGICSVDSPNLLSRNQFKTNLSAVLPQTPPQIAENGNLGGTPDAYCNICQKSFCNKYFLKKHRQNIHGIIENGLESSPTVPSSIHVPVISSLSSPLLLPSIESKVDGASLEQALKKLKCKLTNATQNGINLNVAGKQTPVSNRNGSEGNTERFLCELCNIEFCDKHYLNTHKQNKHGSELVPIISNDFIDFSEIGKHENVDKSNKSCDSTEEFKTQTCIPCMKNFNSIASFYSHMLETHGAKFKEESGIVKKGQNKLDLQSTKKSGCMDNENSNVQGEATPLYCSLCFLKFEDRASLFAHFEANHSKPDTSVQVNGSVGTTHSTEVHCDACSEQFSSKQVLMSHRLKEHGIISPMADSQLDHNEDKAFDMDLSGLPVSKSSHGTFCQVCHQELYNKYFMKTHMLKMHGIDVDALPNEKLPKVDKNLPCDICHKVFGGKTVLKAHKLHVHGITEDSSPVNNIEVDCSSDVESKKLSLQGSEPSSEFSKDENTKIFSCEICSQEFHSKLLLQVHLVNKHVNNGESQVTNLGGLIGLTMSKVDTFSKDFKEAAEELGKNDKLCACCTPITKDGKPGVLGSTLLLCHICNVSYPSSNRYQHHLAHIDLMVCETNNKSKKVNHIKGNSNDLPDSSLENSYNHNINKDRSKSRKLKRFRCSKCDKTFRTRNKCLHHIQMVHKNKKGMSNHVDHLNKHLEANHLMSNMNSAAPPLISPNCITETEDGKREMPPSVPYLLPENSRNVIMQPFHLSEPKTDSLSKPDVFVPSLVYLPVSRRVSGPVTVAFTLTPA